MTGGRVRWEFSRSQVAIWTSWFVLALLLAGQGCRTQDDATIRLQLNWFPDAQHGGFFAADVHGYFAEEGLEVEILPGGPGTPVIPKLAMGQVEFVVTNADQILLARAQGADIVALLAPLQASPRCIMVHAASGIRSFDGLRNLVLAMGEGKAFAEFLKQQVPLEGVRIVPYTGNVAKFLNDTNYAQQAYVFSEPLVAARAGGDPHSLMVADLGFNPYTSLLVTNSQTILQRRELVERFVRAARRGWQTYLENSTPSNRKIHELNPEMELAQLEASAVQVRQLCLPPGRSPERLGDMSSGRWQVLAQQLVELELLAPDRVDAAAAFTREFLQPEH